MWRNIIISAMVICFVSASITNAGLILTIDGSNPTGIPFMLSGTGPYQIALDGNTTFEPNDIRFEAVGGTLTVISDVNHQYSFSYDSGSTAGLIWLITNTALTIDEINVPADTTIYELFIFCNPDVNLTWACGSDLSFLFPPPQEEEQVDSTSSPRVQGGQDDSVMEQPFGKFGINTQESTFMGDIAYSQSTSSEYQQCGQVDLYGDGIIAFQDLAGFAQNWLLTGAGFIGDFNDSNSVDYNDLSIFADCWLKGTLPLDVWEQFKTALRNDDLDAALTFIADSALEQYTDVLTQLRPNFPGMVNGMGNLVLISLDADRAKYEMLHDEGGGVISSFPVYFSKDAGGNWKIYCF